MLEERRHQRRIAFPFRVTITVDGKGAIDVFHTENISIGGIRIISQCKLERNTQVDVIVDTGKGIIECHGKVAWFLEIKPAEEYQSILYDMGIEFISMSPADKELLENILNSLQDRKAV